MKGPGKTGKKTSHGMDVDVLSAVAAPVLRSNPFAQKKKAEKQNLKTKKGRAKLLFVLNLIYEE